MSSKPKAAGFSPSRRLPSSSHDQQFERLPVVVIHPLIPPVAYAATRSAGSGPHRPAVLQIVETSCSSLRLLATGRLALFVLQVNFCLYSALKQ